MLARLIAPLALLMGITSASANPASFQSLPEHTEEIPVFPDFRAVNGYFYQWQLTPEWGAGVFLGFEWQNRIVNLTPAKPTLPGGIPELELDDYSGGLRATRTRGLDLAIAPIGFLERARNLGPWTPFAGLLPLYGSRSVSSQFVPTRERLAKLPRLAIPTEVSDLHAWNLNDWLIFESTGGVLFLAGGGSTITTGLELRLLAAGEWSIAIEKVGPRSVYVRLLNKTIHSFTQTIGAATAALENTLFKNQDESFSYDFDLSDPQGYSAYQQMLSGNLIPAQELAQKAHPSVRSVDSLQTTQRGRLSFFRLGFPAFSYMGQVKGRIHSVQTLTAHADGSTTETETGIQLKERAVGGLFMIDRRVINDFFATSIVTRTPEGKITEETYGGQFVWAYENAKASPRRLLRELRKVVKQTGLREELSVSVPNERLGYVHASLRVVFDEETTDELIRSEQEKSSGFYDTRATSSRLIKDYFAGGDDPDGLCPDIVLTYCARHLRKETEAALNKARRQIRQMDDARKAGDRTGFVRAYAALGKTLVTNQFTFKATLSQLKKRPASIHFKVAGERISFLKKAIEREYAIP